MYEFIHLGTLLTNNTDSVQHNKYVESAPNSPHHFQDLFNCVTAAETKDAAMCKKQHLTTNLKISKTHI